MNLVDQIFEQAKAGSAQGQGFGQFFAQGVQQGQEQQRIDQQKQQLAIQIAQAPLQQTLLQQNSQLNALKIEQGLRAKQDDIEADKAFTGLQGAIFDKLNSGDLPGAVMEYAKGVSEHPTLALVDKYKALGGQLEAMQKESDIVQSRAAMNAARMEAAKGAQFRTLPPGMRLQKLLDNTKAQLADALDPETGDPTLAAVLQSQIPGIESQLQIEQDKLKNQQNKVSNEADRIKAQQERTKAIQARTLELGNRLNRGDLSLMNQKIKVIQDQPNSKMDFDAKMKAINDIHAEFEAKTKTYSQPGSNAPVSGAPGPATPSVATPKTLRLGTVVIHNGERYIYRGGPTDDEASFTKAQ